MAVKTTTTTGTPFYDPYYGPGMLKTHSEEIMTRWYDDFSLFNVLHLSKSESLYLNASILGEKQSPYPSRQRGAVPVQFDERGLEIVPATKLELVNLAYGTGNDATSNSLTKESTRLPENCSRFAPYRYLELIFHYLSRLLPRASSFCL